MTFLIIAVFMFVAYKITIAKFRKLEAVDEAEAIWIEQIEREQQKQAKQIAKHEEQIVKLEQKMASAESEIAFNREQVDKLFALLGIEQAELDAAVYGSDTWQKKQKRVIALENRIHTCQRRINKAKADIYNCKQKLSA